MGTLLLGVLPYAQHCALDQLTFTETPLHVSQHLRTNNNNNNNNNNMDDSLIGYMYIPQWTVTLSAVEQSLLILERGEHGDHSFVPLKYNQSSKKCRRATVHNIIKNIIHVPVLLLR